MNSLELKAEIMRCGLNIPRLAETIGMNVKTLYLKINGDSTFKQDEIVKISQALNLKEDKIMAIFFADIVSYRKQSSVQEENKISN